LDLLQTMQVTRAPKKYEAGLRTWFPGIAAPYAVKARRKILIVEDKPTASNILHHFFEVLDYDGAIAIGCDQALAMIAGENFDAVLLDLRNSNTSAEPFLWNIEKIRTSLAGRVLVITCEVEQPKASKSFGSSCLPPAADIRLMENVQQRLLALWDQTDTWSLQQDRRVSGPPSIDKLRRELGALIEQVVSRLHQSVVPDGAASEEFCTELQKASDNLMEVSSGQLRQETEEALHLITEQLSAKEGQLGSEAADIFRRKIAEIFAILQPGPGDNSQREILEPEALGDLY